MRVCTSCKLVVHTFFVFCGEVEPTPPLKTRKLFILQIDKNDRIDRTDMFGHNLGTKRALNSETPTRCVPGVSDKVGEILRSVMVRLRPQQRVLSMSGRAVCVS